MRKRRFGGINEALTTLRSAVSAAAATQAQLPESTHPAPLPQALPRDVSTLNNLGSISDEELASLQAEFAVLLKKVEADLSKWDELGKQLRSALDATLSMITLKSEQPVKRRRAQQSPSPAPEGDDESRTPLSPSADGAGAAGAAGSADAEVDIGELNAAGKLSKLEVGQQVAFKVPKSAVDEWIQCEITRVLTPNSRFEVRDPEPDDFGNPGKTYNARVRDIIPLPLPDKPLKPLPVGSIVLARYPETTAFYKARVGRYSAKRRAYYLRFEGEDDAQKEIEVSDGYVVPARKK